MALRNTTSAFGVPFNDTVTRVSKEQRAQAVQGAQLTDLVQSLYSLVLYDIREDETVTAIGLDPAKRTENAEYFFRVPPKTHELGEPFATSVQGTQDGGKFVESYGSIIKLLRLTGTTGLRPNKSAPASIPLLGITDNQLSSVLGSGLNTNLRGIPPDERTGYDDILFLRNLFRKYSDIKTNTSLAGQVVMLWRNIKDADYWVVEPEEFKLSQNSSSPLTYEYHISLKTLSRFDFAYAVPEDSLEDARARQRMFARLQEYGQNILNIFLTLSTNISRIAGYATFISNTVLSPILGVLNGLNAVKTSAYGVVRGLRTQVLTLIENVETAITLLAAELPVQDIFVRDLRRLVVNSSHILTEPVAQDNSVADANRNVDRYASAYSRPGTLTTARRAPTTSPTYIGYESTTEAVGSATVGSGEDIRDLARRLLGDPARWRILAVLNTLRSPFTAAVGAPGVLAPGDRILFPRAATTGSTDAAGGAEIPSSDGTGDPVTAAYGRDLLLVSEIVGDQELTDLSLDQGGDLATIQGVPNVVQAIRLKFATERGELAAHPKYGAKYAIGSKATASSFNELRINTLSTLSSDPRVESINDLNFLAIGDQLGVSADIKLANASDILQTNLALRRF